MKDFKDYFSDVYVSDNIRFHRLVPVLSKYGSYRFRMRKGSTYVYLSYADLTRFFDSDVYYYTRFGDKNVHIYFVNLNNLSYEKKEKKISPWTSA